VYRMIIVFSHHNFSRQPSQDHLVVPTPAGLDYHMLATYITTHAFGTPDHICEQVQTENPVQACESQVQNYTGVDVDLIPDSVSVPTHFMCPISMDVMRDPCVASDGHTYERTFILKWFATSNKSPATNVQLASKALLPNINLRIAITEWFAVVKETRQT
jgi:hypothetical protein